jgi:Holliday junction resolvasome RuvABC endonuclease subunit
VRILTGLDQAMETEDVSDALAVAICHATFVARSGIAKSGMAATPRTVAGGLR